ncbi:MAG: pyridoxine 5'-phosphate synthase [Sandaracinaceae bacterium]|nr:pyridoxine 5'-phosphate synthase [Sandaracinaceae bacterium]MBK7154092.1 pyridoxine 5'-phosphate synthase [Sandaracinaceae bacterium]
MARLSVNVNKVATLRNSRGGDEPNVLRAVRACVAAGAPGITVHPRADERHIRLDDVRVIAEELAPIAFQVELNVEGDPRPDLVALVRELRPAQFTLVPVRPGEITSEAGWPPGSPTEALRELCTELRELGVRSSIFVDPTPAAVDFAASLGADRVELYTEPYARAFERGDDEAQASLATYVVAAKHARTVGLGVNAGHDLDLRNLPLFKALPGLKEVSIGHALMSEALFRGLPAVVRDYLDVLR